MKIAILVPSRGLVFSRTTETIANAILTLTKAGHEVKYFCSHDQPIPDGHNVCVDQALEWGADRFLFIEEDMVISPDAILSLCDSTNHMATLQYNDKNGRPRGIIEFSRNDEVVWCGLGATAVSKEVIQTVSKPVFCITRRWKRVPGPNGIGYERVGRESIYQYGGLDVDFCMRVRERGYKIVCIKEHTARHLQLISLGTPYENRGMHSIREV